MASATLSLMVSALMTFKLQMLFGMNKPLATLFFLGPPAPRDQRMLDGVESEGLATQEDYPSTWWGIVKLELRPMLCALLVIATFVFDTRKVFLCFAHDHATWWSSVAQSLMIAAVSPNLPSMLNAVGLVSLYGGPGSYLRWTC